MYYQPTQNEKLIPLPWQWRFGYLSVLWPLQDSPSRWMRIADTAFTVFVLCCFLFEFEASANSFAKNFSDITVVTDNLASLAIYSECILRVCDMAFRKNSLKHLLKIFYRDVYISKDENCEIYRKIQKSMIFIKIYSYFSILSIVFLSLGPVVSAVLYNSRLMPVRLQFHYNIDDPVIYAITLAVPLFNGLIVLLILTGDLYLLGFLVRHLCARYTILENSLEDGAKSLRNVPSSKVSHMLREILNIGVKKTQMLNEFAELLIVTYSFRIFCMITHGGIMLCAVTFQTTLVDFGTSEFGSFVGWLGAKLLELLIFGELGSSFMKTTDNISSAYYQCTWESILVRSENPKQNLLLMKDIYFAILIFKKPLQITGLGFFNLSIPTAASLIRLAGSYYTFLKTFQ